MLLHVTLINPPAGVLFALQDKKNQLSQHILSTGANITFQLEIDLDGKGIAQGKFAMGPPVKRFFYINSGTYAGPHGTPQNTSWSRRAKVPLTGLPNCAEAEAEIKGTAKDGGPACATVPLLNGAWRSVRP